MNAMVDVQNLSKQFTLHNQGGICFTVLDNVSFTVNSGECVALLGSSGSGKSTLMRSLYGNYKAKDGSIWINDGEGQVDIASAAPRQVMRLREQHIGYVSQFLRVIPRVSALEVVMEPLRKQGVSRELAEDRAVTLLKRLNVPETLWSLAPSTFSGGEQQRVNIARGFISEFPILLLDEPTASLDAKNRDIVASMIIEAKQKGTALVGIFHDEEVRNAVSDRQLDLT